MIVRLTEYRVGSGARSYRRSIAQRTKSSRWCGPEPWSTRLWKNITDRHVQQAAEGVLGLSLDG